MNAYPITYSNVKYVDNYVPKKVVNKWLDTGLLDYLPMVYRVPLVLKFQLADSILENKISKPSREYYNPEFLAFPLIRKVLKHLDNELRKHYGSSVVIEVFNKLSVRDVINTLYSPRIFNVVDDLSIISTDAELEMVAMLANTYGEDLIDNHIFNRKYHNIFGKKFIFEPNVLYSKSLLNDKNQFWNKISRTTR